MNSMEIMKTYLKASTSSNKRKSAHPMRIQSTNPDEKAQQDSNNNNNNKRKEIEHDETQLDEHENKKRVKYIETSQPQSPASSTTHYSDSPVTTGNQEEPINFSVNKHQLPILNLNPPSQQKQQIFQCLIKGCNSVFSSKSSRDRHSLNTNLHKKLLSIDFDNHNNNNSNKFRIIPSNKNYENEIDENNLYEEDDVDENDEQKSIAAASLQITTDIVNNSIENSNYSDDCDNDDDEEINLSIKNQETAFCSNNSNNKIEIKNL